MFLRTFISTIINSISRFQIFLLITESTSSELNIYWDCFTGSFRPHNIKDLRLSFHTVSVFRSNILRISVKKKKLLWMDMTLRFLSSTVNAFSEKLVMETFHENKFM